MPRLLVSLLFVVACGNGGTTGDDVAPPIDSAQQGSDGPPAAACTGAVFDPCTDNTQCMSNNCHLYKDSQLQVCVQACTPGDNTTCPVDKTGANGVCNMMGICKPTAPNDCTRN